MKHIPTLTLTALAAAASAQTAPAAAPVAATGFNYNTVSVNYSNEDFKSIGDGLTITTLELSNKIAKNLVATIGIAVSGAEEYNGYDISNGLLLGIAYVHTLDAKTDLVLSVSSLNANTGNDDDSQSISFINYDLGLRHNLGSGLELTASVGRDNYTHEESDSAAAGNGSDRTTASVGLGYALSKELSVSAKAKFAFADSGQDDTESRGYSLSVAYNY